MADKQSSEVQADSMVQRLIALAVGASESKSERIEGKKGSPALSAAVADRLDNSMQAACARAKRKTGRTYKIERNQFITRSGDVMVTVIATCMEST